MKTLKRRPGYSIKYDSWFVPLTQGVISLVDADMVPILSQNHWCAYKKGLRWLASRTYREPSRKQGTILMHRVIMNAPPNMEVDHREYFPVDFRTIDNRRSNLRVCTKSQNQRNRRNLRPSSSRFKGVHRHKRDEKWYAQIKVNNRRIHLGQFEDETDAARAYDAAAVLLHGEFRRTNEALLKTEESKA